MIAVAYGTLIVAAASFTFRAIAGPSLSDRVIGIDGVIVAGISLLLVNAVDTGRGAFLPVAVVLALVSFVSTSVVARFIEGRDE
ncbi:MAG: monovalent cation/H+ antiporter complex subunit F [Ilumatobacteraceae bacterium]